MWAVLRNLRPFLRFTVGHSTSGFQSGSGFGQAILDPAIKAARRFRLGRCRRAGTSRAVSEEVIAERKSEIRMVPRRTAGPAPSPRTAAPLTLRPLHFDGKSVGRAVEGEPVRRRHGVQDVIRHVGQDYAAGGDLLPVD